MDGLHLAQLHIPTRSHLTATLNQYSLPAGGIATQQKEKSLATHYKTKEQTQPFSESSRGTVGVDKALLASSASVMMVMKKPPPSCHGIH